MTTQRKLKLKDIETGGGTQMRERLCEGTLTLYAESYADGAEMDPITVYFDGSTYWLADGFHRLFAAEKAKCKTITANVLRGTREDARWHACGANKHGLHRTNEDKRKAVLAALSHRNGAGKSDRAIAQHVGVSHNFVGSIRKQLSSDDSCEEPETRVGRDGVERRLPQKQTPNAPTVEQDGADDWPGPGFDSSEDPEPEPEDDRPLQEEEEAAPAPESKVEEEPADPVKEFDAPVRAFVREFSAMVDRFDAFAASNEYTQHFYSHHERENFKGFLTRAKQVITANRPYAICGHCGGEDCHECGYTGVLPRNLAERIL